MSQHSIVSLRCPSCGATSSQPSRQMAFGAEFRCAQCSTVSVLVIHSNLIAASTLLSNGQRICVSCGEVLTQDARFCQLGHSQFQQCLGCYASFPIDHLRCDNCGRLPIEVQREKLHREIAAAEVRLQDVDLLSDSSATDLQARLASAEAMQTLHLGLTYGGLIALLAVWLYLGFSKSGFWAIAGALTLYLFILVLPCAGALNLVHDWFDKKEPEMKRNSERLSAHRAASERRQKEEATLSDLKTQLITLESSGSAAVRGLPPKEGGAT